MNQRPHLFDLTPGLLRQMVEQKGLPPYRAQQVLDWVYRKRVIDPQQMTNLSRADRQWLSEQVRFETGQVVRHQIASDGVQKLLIQWEAPTHDSRSGETPSQDRSLTIAAGPSAPATPRQTECVMIPVDEDADRDSPAARGDRAVQGGRGIRGRRTACISSQVGCPVGCRFCASGLGGLDGNLSAGQIVEQVWRLATLEAVERITHVVFMGMGEPLANFDPVVHAAQTLCAPWGMGISARKITISTVGLPAQIRRLAQVGLPLTLAISLHAPNDELRRQLIPWAKYVTIAQVLAAGQDYFEQTGREITLEYILLRAVNDRPEQARELADVARQLRANINLIRYNPVEGLPFERPADRDVLRFEEILRRAGVNTHIRASRGRDIAAACGQLRHQQRAALVAGQANP